MISEILEQMIMGSANTPRTIMHFYHMMNLSMCSLNLISIPQACTSMYFSDIFEFCVKSKPSKIPIAIYKRHTEDNTNASGQIGSVQQDNTDKERTQRKFYVWLHPPRKIELQPYDELFVLTENYQDEESSASKKEAAGSET